MLYVIAALVGNAISDSAWSWWLFGLQFTDQGAWYEVARASVAFAAGLGIGAAVLLSYRRQSLLERRESFDAGNEEYRRASELYSTAVEQLGNESPTIRLAAVYSLGRLGNAHPEFRQNVIDIWCAYLRMPSELQLVSASSVADNELHQRHLEAAEQNVREAVQNLMLEKLRDNSPRNWYDDFENTSFAIDLHSAWLTDFDAFGVRMHGDVNFEDARFLGRTDFRRATLSGVQSSFNRCEFHGIADFQFTTF